MGAGAWSAFPLEVSVGREALAHGRESVPGTSWYIARPHVCLPLPLGLDCHIHHKYECSGLWFGPSRRPRGADPTSHLRILLYGVTCCPGKKSLPAQPNWGAELSSRSFPPSLHILGAGPPGAQRGTMSVHAEAENWRLAEQVLEPKSQHGAIPPRSLSLPTPRGHRSRLSCRAGRALHGTRPGGLSCAAVETRLRCRMRRVQHPAGPAPCPQL